MAVAFLAACDKPSNVAQNPGAQLNNPNPDVEAVNAENEYYNYEAENIETANPEEETYLEDAGQYFRTSLTNEELDEIDSILFPSWYVYERYVWDGGENTSGEYSYAEGEHVLLPIIASRVSREVQSSELQDGMIYTTALVTLEDGSKYSVLYVNNPETLEYIAASVSTDVSTTLYTFKY